jgi:hypothetical protein
MMSTLRMKLFAAAAVTFVWTGIQPGPVSAQTSGVGGDGSTRILFRSTNGRPRIVKFDINLQPVQTRDYLAYEGWTPVAITVASNSHTYMLWRHTSGATSVWQMDENLNGVAGGGYESGPENGWTAQGLSSGPEGQVQIIWRLSDGRVAVYAFHAYVDRLQYVERQFHGPFFGWDPGAP